MQGDQEGTPGEMDYQRLRGIFHMPTTEGKAQNQSQYGVCMSLNFLKPHLHIYSFNLFFSKGIMEAPQIFHFSWHGKVSHFLLPPSLVPFLSSLSSLPIFHRLLSRFCFLMLKFLPRGNLSNPCLTCPC